MFSTDERMSSLKIKNGGSKLHKKDKIPGYRRLGNYISKHRYMVLYLIILGCLTVYIIKNWSECTAMQFFSSFDGDNILFLVWIVLIVLVFYDVEAKDTKIHVKKVVDEQAQRELANKEYIVNMLQMKAENRNIDKNRTCEEYENVKVENHET